MKYKEFLEDVKCIAAQLNEVYKQQAQHEVPVRSVIDAKWRRVLATKWRPVTATEWRHFVATGVSPWFVPQPRFSVPKGRHESVLEQRECRPFRTHYLAFVWSTGSRPWLQPAVPLGLNRIYSKPKACSAVPCSGAFQ